MHLADISDINMGAMSKTHCEFKGIKRHNSRKDTITILSVILNNPVKTFFSSF